MIRSMQPSDITSLAALSVGKMQQLYVKSAAYLLENRISTDIYHVIIWNDVIIGMFIIDTVYHRSYNFAAENELGLRAFFIDQSYQGKGLGKIAVIQLGVYLKKEFSDYSFIVLTVNCKNIGVYACYQQSGFNNTGALYLKGNAGPQYIMCMHF